MKRGLAMAILILGVGWLASGAGAVSAALRGSSFARELADTERARLERTATEAVTDAKAELDAALAALDERIAGLEQKKTRAAEGDDELESRIDRLIAQKAEASGSRVRRIDAELAKLMRQRELQRSRAEPELERTQAKLEALRAEREETRATLESKLALAEAGRAAELAALETPASVAWWRPAIAVALGLGLIALGVVLLLLPGPGPTRPAPPAEPEVVAPVAVVVGTPARPRDEGIATVQDVRSPIRSDDVPPVSEMPPEVLAPASGRDTELVTAESV